MSISLAATFWREGASEQENRQWRRLFKGGKAVEQFSLGGGLLRDKKRGNGVERRPIATSRSDPTRFAFPGEQGDEVWGGGPFSHQKRNAYHKRDRGEGTKREPVPSSLASGNDPWEPGPRKGNYAGVPFAQSFIPSRRRTGGRTMCVPPGGYLGLMGEEPARLGRGERGGGDPRPGETTRTVRNAVRGYLTKGEGQKTAKKYLAHGPTGFL